MHIPQRRNQYFGPQYRPEPKKSETTHFSRLGNSCLPICGVNTGKTTNSETAVDCDNCNAILEEEKSETKKARESYFDLLENDTEEMRRQILRSVNCGLRQVWLDVFYDDNDMTQRIKELKYKEK